MGEATARGPLMPRLTTAAAMAAAMEATAVAMEATATAKGPLMLTTAAATVVAMEAMATVTASKSTKDETSQPFTSESRDLILNPFFTNLNLLYHVLNQFEIQFQLEK